VTTPSDTKYGRAPSTGALIAYSLTAIPLSMAALPIYVHVPKFYADNFGVSLGLIGILLLFARVFDAVQDPLLGAWSDSAQRRKEQNRGSRFGRYIYVLGGAPLLAAAMIGLFNPPQWSGNALNIWFFSMLILVYTAFSMVQISYQAYAIDLADDLNQRTRITAFREGFGLLGVFLAAALPQILTDASNAKTGFAQYSFVFAPVLIVAVLITVFASPPAMNRAAQITQSTINSWQNTWRSMWAPLQNYGFRKLLLIFIVNGIAASIPATLVLFFIDYVLRTPQFTAQLLCAYFAAGALGMPLWIMLANRFGKSRAWLAGMVLSIAAFVWAFMLGEGDITGFFIICAMSGLGLGADLAIPPAMVADVIDDDIAKGLAPADGAYLGLWNLCSKMNLALAAFVALGVVEYFGLKTGAAGAPAIQTPQALTALAITYALLPCVLKAASVWLLWRAKFKN
jgi:glycoside/pentoside/hexuronide:cation symporter, GPH family